MDSLVLINMHSVAMKEPTVEAIKGAGVREVWLYLDHDEAGNTIKDYFQEQMEGLTIKDQSHLYTGYNDFSDFLVANLHKPASFSFHQ